MTELEVLDKKLGKVIDPESGAVFCNMRDDFKNAVLSGISTIYDLSGEYTPLPNSKEGIVKDIAGFNRYVLPLNGKELNVNHYGYVKIRAPYESFSFTDEGKYGCSIRGTVDIPIHDENKEIRDYGYLTMAGSPSTHFTVYLFKSENNQELITFWKQNTLDETIDFIRTGNFEYILKNSDKFKKDVSELIPGRAR